MSLTLEDVEKIARLARLRLEPSEAVATLSQLNDIFELLEQMRSIPTDDVVPLATPLAAIEEVTLRLREDRITEGDQRERFQEGAPAVREGLYLVPKVIE